jgi:hypothetical protein
MKNLVPLAQVIDVYGVVEDLLLNVKCYRIEIDCDSVINAPVVISPDELHAIRDWYITAWAMHLQVTSRARKEKPEIKVGNLMEFSCSFTPYGGKITISEGTLCRVVFPPRKVGYGLAPSTVRVRVNEKFLSVPLHCLTTIWSPLRPEDAEMTASRKWNGNREVCLDIMSMWSPLAHKCLKSYVDEARFPRVYASAIKDAHQSSCTQPSPTIEHQQD